MSRLRISSANINSYFSLRPLLSKNDLITFKIADAIKLSIAEKERHNLNYPFRTIPAMKIAKLAVDETFIEKYKGIGTIMIQAAENIIYGLNNDYCAARFLTVDADIEHDQNNTHKGARHYAWTFS